MDNLTEQMAKLRRAIERTYKPGYDRTAVSGQVVIEARALLQLLESALAHPAAGPAGYAEMRDALAFIERGILEGSIKCKPYIEFDPSATSLEPKSVLDLVRAAMLAANKENSND